MDKVIGLITANYDTPALGNLTEERTVASLPFGSRYRLIDFPLSNMVNSGINTVGLITPYKYRSIIDHVGAGEAWTLDRRNGGLFILPGSVFGISSIGARFLLRDISRNVVYLMRSPAPYVLVTTSNLVCNFDYTELMHQHIESGADMTMVYKPATEDDDNRLSLKIQDGRVLGCTPGVKKGHNGFLDTFIISRSLLLKILEWYASIDHLDFFEIMEENFERMDVRPYRFDGYAEAIFTVKSYYEHSMKLLNIDVQNELFKRENPILTKVQGGTPSKYLVGSSVKNSLISSSCTIEGTVENSILFNVISVGKGAVIKNSIIMQSCVIEEGAYIENAIIDRSNIVYAGTVIKGTRDSIFIKEKNML